MQKKAGSGDWERGYGTCGEKLGVETGNEAIWFLDCRLNNWAISLSKIHITLCVIAATGEQRNSGHCLKLLFASLNHVSLKHSHSYIS